MDSYKVFKGKAGTPSFSMRYNAEDDELEHLVDEPPSSEDASTEDSRDTLSEMQDKKPKDSPKFSRVIKRSSSLDDPPGETWKFFTDIKGRITKTVEEKIEEIKSDRLKKKEKKKLMTGGENSSVSDSEEKSDLSTSLAVSVAASAGGGSPSHSTSVKHSQEDDDEPTESDLSDSTPVREFGPSAGSGGGKRHFAKRGSIEVAEEAVEENETVQSAPRRVPPTFVPMKTSLPASCNSSPSKRLWDLALCYWPVLLPVFFATVFFYIPLPKEILWACLGGIIVLEFRRITDRLGLWASNSHPTFAENDCLFTGNFHFDSFHILPDQMRQLPSSDPETILHQGWLNEYRCEYSDETYKLRDTTCIWASLRGCHLTLSTPVRPPPRKAFWSEPQHPKSFTHHRLYDLTNCKVSLLPEGLTNKRIWSKKYPIYIELTEESYRGSSYRDPLERDISGFKSSDSSQQFDADVASEAFDEQSKDSSNVVDRSKMPQQEAREGSEEDDSFMERTPAPEESEYSDFVHVSPSLVEKRLFLCLFARSDREKEIWFRRIVAAIGYSSGVGANDSFRPIINDNVETLKGCREKLNKSYSDFMHNLAQSMPKPLKKRRKRSKDGFSGSMWFNVFLSRIYYDLIHNPVCMSILQDKVQRKLSTVKLPGIVEGLVVSRLVVEGPGPVVDGWTEPRMDSSGVWADIDISYQGLTSITIDIQINLTGKKKDSLPPSPQKGSEDKRSAVYNSSLEDSGESSTDSEDRLDTSQQVTTPPRKISTSPSVVNRITNKYFNQVAENKLVKKALEGVSSNTHISLIVEIRALVGTLVINIPPPPTNRIWYGFRPQPKLCMRARPVLGETVVSLVNISNWIEKKLYKEFEKVLVLPNMDDLVVPLMDRNVPF